MFVLVSGRHILGLLDSHSGSSFPEPTFLAGKKKEKKEKKTGIFRTLSVRGRPFRCSRFFSFFGISLKALREKKENASQTPLKKELSPLKRKRKKEKEILPTNRKNKLSMFLDSWEALVSSSAGDTTCMPFFFF